MNLQAFMIGVSATFFAIFSIHILFFRRVRTRYQTVLGIVMGIWSIWMAKDLVTTFTGMYTRPILDWILMIDGWSAVAYVILVMEAVQPGWTTVKRVLWLLSPFMLFTILYAFLPVRGVVYVYVAFLWFFAWTVVILAWIRVKRYIRFINDNYSNIEGIDISWLRPVFVFAIITQLAWLFISLYAFVWTDIAYYLLTIAVWLSVLYYSWNYSPIIVEHSESEVGEQSRLTKAALIDEEALRRLIDEENIYLNPNLTLANLAKAVGTNRTYMSNWLSEVQGQTFYNYINQLRVERMSIPLMKEHPEYKIEYIASLSGFSSISTFRRAFTKLTGRTPSQYMSDSKADMMF